MRHRPPENLLLSGASGAVGLEFLPMALARWPGVEVICLARSDRAKAAIRAAAGKNVNRVRVVAADLTDDDTIDAAVDTLKAYRCDRAIGIHAAADVSWDRQAEDMANLNVGGTARFQRLIKAVARQPKLIYLSTAYTSKDNWTYRNGYEFTKAASERLLADAAQEMPVSVFALSLVVGNSKTGAIARFNGVYPMFKALAEFSPPFLVGSRTTCIDIVPVDWVCRELADFVERQWGGDNGGTVVAAAGPQAQITFEALVREGERAIADFDRAHGLAPADPMPLIKSRQWDFLQRCAKAWQVQSGIAASDFRSFERMLKVYSSYAESAACRAPEGITSVAPKAESYLPRVFDRWLGLHEERVLRRRRRLRGLV